eukprot:scaffold454_cov124-Isochrysis_galbana.AAC.10
MPSANGDSSAAVPTPSPSTFRTFSPRSCCITSAPIPSPRSVDPPSSRPSVAPANGAAIDDRAFGRSPGVVQNLAWRESGRGPRDSVCTHVLSTHSPHRRLASHSHMVGGRASDAWVGWAEGGRGW